ncbi:MAG: biotin--[acetyl-CoA-carboxylase] ligase [Lewinellaceae bacterium]|nr:biotin--[acetyl-CoA-carboxylase] ligase [Phaeodactylibacter sp.]MCB9037597.1 biotin--[acetyl-CoA-carboxylase] ligase [Lewinellaceae bacterium]
MRKKNTLFIGKVFHEFPALPSTNLYALELLSKSKPSEGTVVSAVHQTAGRGQIGSSWDAKAGQNITLSVILYPSFLPARQQFSLTQAVALSVRDLAARYTEKPVKVKWPNDIYIGNGKVAGILIQTTLSHKGFQNCVAGVGVNVNQQQFSPLLPNPTSLSLAAGRFFELPPLIEEYCQALEHRYLQLKNGRLQAIGEEYLRHLYGIGRKKLFERPGGEQFTGQVSGVNADGQLLIRHNGREEAFHLKEVRMVLGAG